MATPNNKLGSYTGTLTWDPAILDYVSYSGAPPTGFTGSVNTANVDAGQIAFNGANASGATGDTVVLRITFDAVAVGVSDLNLEYSAMAAANTFESLLPFLTVNDSQVDVSPSGYTLSVTKAGAGTGTVTSEPAGINCGATCSAVFAENAEVTLTAVASGDSIFVGWSGAGCSGTGTCVVTMSEARSVEATFNLLVGVHYLPVVSR